MEQSQEIKKETEKKSIPIGNLKKERFKPMQKFYNPVKSEQIKGILSDNCTLEEIEKKNKF
jgi:hypothetical protein